MSWSSGLVAPWVQDISIAMLHWSYGDVPTWIEAIATVGAFIAAILAARWTAGTVRSAREQVAIAKETATTARDQARQAEEAAQAQLASMSEQLEFARAEAKEAEGRFLRAQLDAQAPVVYMRATRPRLAAMPLSDYIAAPSKLFDPENGVTAPFEVQSIDRHFFGMTFNLELVNCGDKPARVDFLENNRAELVDNPPGQEVVVPPGERRELVWVRTISSMDLMVGDTINAADVSHGQIKYWVRDLGMIVQDEYRFNLDLRYFSRDGSRLLVEPRPVGPWTEKFGSQVPPRHYAWLDRAAENDASSPL